MSSSGKYKHTYREWRVNIDGHVVVGRWKNAYGAIAGAFDKVFGNAGMNEPRPDYTDLVIHVECIGDPLPDPAPVPREMRRLEQQASMVVDLLSTLGGLP